MSGPRTRRLLSVRRRVPASSDYLYGQLWAELTVQVESDGSHAWRFVAPGDAELRLEFLEFAEARDPREKPGVAAILARLDSEIGRAAVEEWLQDA